MKITTFTNTYAPLIGGIERSVATFGGDLRALGHHVLIVTLQPGEQGASTDETVLRLTTFPGDDGLTCAWALAGIYERAIRGFGKARACRANDAGIETRQCEVESEWRRLVEFSPAMRVLLPTRGFPGFAPGSARTVRRSRPRPCG